MTTIQGLDKLNRKLKELEQFQKAMHDPMEESLALLQDDLATRPRKMPGAFSKYATPGQRRAYWFLVKRGYIDHGPHGYKRTGTISRMWTSAIIKTGRGLKGMLGNASRGARFVQGDDQQPFHKASGWRTTEQAIERNSKKILAKFDRKVKLILSK